MKQLAHGERMRLLEFVCSFAWTDLRVTDRERALIRRLAAWLGLGAEDLARVKAWLEVPPPVEAVDPTQIPRAHRALFLEAVRAVVEVDGVNQAELDALALFEDLIR